MIKKVTQHLSQNEALLFERSSPGKKAYQLPELDCPAVDAAEALGAENVRPEIEGFISIAPPANLYDFSFLAPCPSSGLIVHGEKDAVVPPKDVNTLVEKLKTQKGIVIDQQIIPGANHFFDGKLQPLMETVTGYLDMRLANVR